MLLMRECSQTLRASRVCYPCVRPLVGPHSGRLACNVKPKETVDRFSASRPTVPRTPAKEPKVFVDQHRLRQEANPIDMACFDDVSKRYQNGIVEPPVYLQTILKEDRGVTGTCIVKNKCCVCLFRYPHTACASCQLVLN